MGWRVPEWVHPRVLEGYRRQPRFDVGEERGRLGLSERECQSKLRPPRRIVVFAGRLTKRPRAAPTAEGMTGRSSSDA